ncbi:MBL fold metallo-hydrolase [Salimicrobium halophilum]|uniref:Glyoxylase, beta-lactamase superfamily II n=1 Tax=Salimicrobium halophilum TaxID=86666 RepID=A0A1G8WR45_9BACI|nr:MBL fold metallo-hydrolase [Salimicrobium halophilum]SDJ80603.1 Glyoxylase, beta-lactamase superfamily II [Salimicrobium halophilum]
MSEQPVDLGNDIYLIDGYDMGFQGRTGTYVLNNKQVTLIETGPSPSVDMIKEGLDSLHISLEDVKYVILTHIHLDHAGGAGLLLESCPNAEIIVHPKGKRHLVDPSRLIKGAQAVYGEDFDRLFDPIVPIPEERIIEKGEDDTLTIEQGRQLEFLDTPGHANHHLGIYDPLSNGLFTGDTAGIRYHQVEGLTFYLPTTSPNQFNPEAMLAQIQRFRHKEPSRLYFGHYGMTENPDAAMREVREWITVFVEIAKQEESLEAIEEKLLERIENYVKQLGVPDRHSIHDILKLDVQVCAMGLYDYIQKEK